MKINHVKGQKIFCHGLVIDLYQSINWHRLLLIDIYYHRLSILSIGHAGSQSIRPSTDPINLSIIQSISQSINQSINPSILGSINQSLNRLIRHLYLPD